jgi:hypothetical protein
VIAPGAGLVYSNVAISEPDYNPAATYAKDALVHDPATHLTYQSLVAANTGRALTDITAWVKLEVTNRWKMLDKKNNTQTTNADEILLVLSPEDIAQGVYVGNVDASDVRSSVVDLTEGLVYSHTEEMTMLTAESGDFYEWCFGRIVRADYYATTDLPPYANALVTICLRKDGSTPKCGMAIAGPVDEFGPSLYGLSTGGEDFSTTTFDIDGVSETALHGYAKDMSVDVEVDNGDIDYLHTRLEAYRKKTVVWLGGPYGCTAVCGPYKSFKNVLKGLRKSLMSLEISGVV